MPAKPPAVVHSTYRPKRARKRSSRLLSPHGSLRQSHRRNTSADQFSQSEAFGSRLSAAHRDHVTQDLDALRPGGQGIGAEEHRRPGDAAVELFRELVRRGHR